MENGVGVFLCARSPVLPLSPRNPHAAHFLMRGAVSYQRGVPVQGLLEFKDTRRP